MFSQGYIGVSGNLTQRFHHHAKRSQNNHLKNAINKYGWDNLVKQQLLIADEQYCLDMELKLRPNDKIGWNIVAGGGKPPVLFGNTSRLGKPSPRKGKKHTLESIDKMSEAHKGNTARRGTVNSQECIDKIKATNLKNKWLCPHCSTEGLGKHTATRWHFDNCKNKGA